MQAHGGDVQGLGWEKTRRPPGDVSRQTLICSIPFLLLLALKFRPSHIILRGVLRVATFAQLEAETPPRAGPPCGLT